MLLYVKVILYVKCYFMLNVTLIKPRSSFLLQLMQLVHSDKTDFNASFRYFNEAYCNFFVWECIKNPRNTLFLSPYISLAPALF